MLFSEPKIPQIDRRRADLPQRTEFQCSSASRKFLKVMLRGTGVGQPRVSVLFSEPKIPQTVSAGSAVQTSGVSFSALQRAENSSKRLHRPRRRRVASFSALQRAENSSNLG